MKLNKLFYVALYLFERNERARCVLTAESQAEAERAAREWVDPINDQGARVSSCRYLCDTPASVFEEL